MLRARFASKILPKYTIEEAEFFSCDGCSAEVAARRKALFNVTSANALKASLQELSEKWKKKYPKCGILKDP